MQPSGIFLDKSNQRIASFGLFPFLSQLCRRLKFRETDVWRRRRSDFSTLLLFHCHFFFDETVVTEPGGAAEDDQRQQQHEEPLHGWRSAIVNPSDVRELASLARQDRGERQALIVGNNRRFITGGIVHGIAPVDQMWRLTIPLCRVQARERTDATGAPAFALPRCSRLSGNPDS